MRQDDVPVRPGRAHRAIGQDAGLDIEEGGGLETILDLPLGLQQDVDAKLDKILTSEQKTQLKELRERGPGGRGGRGPGRGPGG